MSNPYRFSGMTDFVAGEGITPPHAAKIPGLYFVARVSEMLSQIPTVEPKHRAAMYAVADEAIAALRASIATAEAAYAHVRAACPTAEEIARAQAQAEAKREADAAAAIAQAEAAKPKPAPAATKEKPLAGA